MLTMDDKISVQMSEYVVKMSLPYGIEVRTINAPTTVLAKEWGVRQAKQWGLDIEIADVSATKAKEHVTQSK